jgi:transketolase
MTVDAGTGTPTAAEVERLWERATFVRTETVRLISIAKTGHYASTFSCAEVFSVLYYDTLRLRRGEPDWPDRDRFLLGKGHAAVGLYPLLADWDFFDTRLLDEYTRLGNPLGDHPDMRRVPGVDFSSGSLGHALSAGLGMALAGRVRHGSRSDGSGYDVYTLLGDGELNEGQVWEAAMSAAHHRLGNLIAIVDRNRYSLDGEVDDVLSVEPLADKWRAFGWEVREVDGHDVGALATLFRELRADTGRDHPVAVIAHTVKGKGVHFMESELGWHLGWLDSEDEAAVHAELTGEAQR